MDVVLGRRRPLACLAVIVGALLMLLPAPARADLRWQPAQEIVGGPRVSEVTIKVDARGNALATWGEVRGANSWELFYAWRTPHGGWGPKRSLPYQQLGYPNAAPSLTPLGVATVVYRIGDSRVGVAIGLPGGALTLIDALGGPDPNSGGFSDLATDDEGGFSVGWTGSDRGIYVATRSAASARIALQQLATDGVGTPPEVAVNPAGAAIAVWSDGQLNTRAAYRLPGATAFGPAEAVPAAWGDIYATIDDQGTALVSSYNTATVRPMLAAFGPPQRVDAMARVAGLAPEPGGSLSLVFSAVNLALENPFGALTITRRSPEGALSAPVLLADVPSCFPATASSPAGDLLVAYVQPCEGAGLNAQVRLRRTAASGFDPPIDLQGSGGASPALTGTGEGIVAFARGPFSLASMALEDLDRPVPPPPTQAQLDGHSLVLPATGQVGLRVRCPVRCKVRPTGILIMPSLLTGSQHSKTRRLAAKKRMRVVVGFSRARVVKARRALRRGERVTLSYTVTTFGRSARALAQSRIVRLRTER
ncbi:MAG: hypothetical protein QOG15_2439 [Solirubrobacteraceae bacterium]|jgi:hypothetical protein|nr:hypothetical protein [Solirubrobacteraceae bacterium]